MSEKPLNALIAEALGWRTWERPSCEGEWFQERNGKPGFIEARPLLDYIGILRNDVKMHQGTDSPPTPSTTGGE